MFKLQSLDNFSQLEEESTLQTPLARLLVKLTYCKSSCWLCAFQANSCFMAIFASVTAAVAVIDSYKRVPKVSFLGCLQLQRAVGQATGCRWGTKHPTDRHKRLTPMGSRDSSVFWDFTRYTEWKRRTGGVGRKQNPDGERKRFGLVLKELPSSLNCNRLHLSRSPVCMVQLH